MKELFDEQKYYFYEDIKDGLKREIEDDFLDINTGKLIVPLVDIVIHKSQSEMFLVLQGEELLQSGKIERFVREWEDKIMSFINFSDDRECVEKMRYDIQLIILYEKENEQQYMDEILEIEKSSRNCRKIFIPMKNGKVLDEGKVFLTNTVLDLIVLKDAENKYKSKMDNMVQQFCNSGIKILGRDNSELSIMENEKLRKWVDQYNADK